VYDADPSLPDSLSTRIESYFRATQVLAHRKFKLGRLTTIRDEPGMRSIRTPALLGIQLTADRGGWKRGARTQADSSQWIRGWIAARQNKISFNSSRNTQATKPYK
jgi:hypothetical protein